MVIALLVALLVQAVTGLFANDDIFTYGPLYDWVGSRASALLTTFHKLQFNILLAFVALHIAAIVFYRVVKGEDLLRPMIHGYKTVPRAFVPSESRQASLWLALVLFGLCAGAWYGLLFLR
jgi:cytochrome b